MSGPAWKINSGEPIPGNILEVIADQSWWAKWFRGGDWSRWRAFLAATFALPMTAEQVEVYRKCTGRAKPPTAPAREIWCCAGRQAGKSRIAATIAAYLAVFVNWRIHTAPGQKATIMIIAADRRQSRVALDYLTSLLVQHPLLKGLIAHRTREAIELTVGVRIEITTCSFRTSRGYSLAAVIADEIAFWLDENAANPATEVIGSLRPALGNMPGSILMAISSPHSRRGPLFDSYQRHWAKDGDPILVWQASTLTMNPSYPREIIDAAYEADPARAAAEFGAQFRTDVETFVAREVVEAATVSSRFELPPVPGINYIAFVDPSGGSSDSMTLAVSHYDRTTKCAVLDAVRERRAPFSPDNVVSEFAVLLKSYGIRKVTGDNYAREWPRERFRVHGIDYDPAEQNKSDIYLGFLPALNSGRVELLDNAVLSGQLVGLERRCVRGGADRIDHAPNARDDVINAAAGACVLAGTARPAMVISEKAMARARERPTGGCAGRRGCKPRGVSSVRVTSGERQTMTTRYRMFSDQDLHDFRAWLDRCPDPQFLKPARGSAGAFDVMQEEKGEQERRFLARLREGISLRQAHTVFEELRAKCDGEAELRQLWTWLASYVVSPPRRNGHAA
jgi:hypothetical protein